MSAANSPQNNLANALNQCARFDCAHLPTPLQPLPRLSAHLGGRVNLWMKRDDCTGLATGGNKARKLDFLIADALAKSADTVITQGALQSNHVRQTAAAAAKADLKCEVLYEHRVAAADADYKNSGNVLLTKLFGAKRFDFPADTDMDAELAHAAQNVKARGHKPYIIPGGGSNPIGALGYVNCALELCAEAQAANLNINHLVHASGSCGTQAGLVVGNFALQNPYPILGVSVRAAREPQEQKVYKLSKATLLYLKNELGWRGDAQELPRDLVKVNSDYVGGGYGIATDGMREAVKLLARLEGILLDPVYSGKGMAGLIDLVRRGEFADGDNIVFLHTGGGATLFAYREIFSSE